MEREWKDEGGKEVACQIRCFRQRLRFSRVRNRKLRRRSRSVRGKRLIIQLAMKWHVDPLISDPKEGTHTCGVRAKMSFNYHHGDFARMHHDSSEIVVRILPASSRFRNKNPWHLIIWNFKKIQKWKVDENPRRFMILKRTAVEIFPNFRNSCV